MIRLTEGMVQDMLEEADRTRIALLEKLNKMGSDVVRDNGPAYQWALANYTEAGEVVRALEGMSPKAIEKFVVLVDRAIKGV